MKPFALNLYNISRRNKELQHLKESLGEGEIILHEDYAENYSIKQQNEIMSMLRSSKQVLIFTAVVYYINEGCLEHLSFADVSHDITHDKGSVFACNSSILSHLHNRLPFIVHTVHYWSDGAASQFKNRYTLDNLVFHISNFQASADCSSYYYYYVCNCYTYCHYYCYYYCY